MKCIRTSVQSLLLCGALLLSGCGGGSGSGSSSSTAVCTGTTPSGLSGATATTMPVYESTCANTVNIPVVTLTVCVPNSTTCEDIPNILIDYGSTGLRLSHTLAIANELPQESTGSGSLTECFLFASGYNYGPVATATIILGTTAVASLPVQISNSSLSPPSSCSSQGASSPLQPYYNGILGVLFPQYDSLTSSAIYYEGGTETTPAESFQVQNPVFLLSTHNNGVSTSFPPVSSLGTTNLTGTLTFGVTPTNFTYELKTDSSGYLTSKIGSASPAQAFFDSGSNGFFFNDSSLPLTQCTAPYAGFYCSSPSPISITFFGTNSTSFPLTFSIVNAETLFGTGNTSFSTLGGTGSSGIFDAGFPAFLLGHSIGLYWISSTDTTGYFLVN